MKKYLFILAVVFIAACDNANIEKEENAIASNEPYTSGEEVDPNGAIAVEEMLIQLGNGTEMPAKVRGKVVDVCQKKGCWMELDKGDGSTIRVTFKDYGFFVPMDIKGREVVINGYVYVDTTSVADLRHYAEDAGKSEEEINLITQPETEVAFEADGVIVY
ncbi:MAG: DUF4920 domain-containing protein [Bacteroidia bacterium]